MNTPLIAGAQAFFDLRRRLDEQGNQSFVGYEGDECDSDPRDYPAMCDSVRRSIEANLFHEDPTHREGYLRALTDLLCTEVEGFAVGKEWDPIRNTAAAFESPRVLGELLRRAAG